MRVLLGNSEYAALDAQIDEMIVCFGAGVWECRVCGLTCKKGDMRRHVEAKAGDSFHTIKLNLVFKCLFYFL